MKCRACARFHGDTGPASSGRWCLAASILMALATVGVQPANAAILRVPEQFGTIQAAIDAAADGDLIRISEGVYTEQVDIDRSVTLEGEGMDQTVIQSPAALDVKFAIEERTYRPVIYVHGGASVQVEELCIDGAGQGAANPGFTGLAFSEASGGVRDVRISGLCETPMGSADHGIALLARSVGATAQTLEVADFQAGSYQEAGLWLAGAGLAAVVQDSWIVGPGEEGGQSAPVGLRVTEGAQALIHDNHIYYNLAQGDGSGPDLLTQVQAIGLSLEDASPNTVVCDNFAAMNDVGLRCTGAASISRLFLLDNRYGGVVLTGGDHSLEEINTQGTHRVGVAVLGDDSPGTTDLHDCCLCGPGGQAGDEGVVGVWAHGAALDVAVDRCTITQWSVGLKPEGDPVQLRVQNSVIASNLVAGYDNSGSTGLQQAALNWWGASGGPVPTLGGDAVHGTGVIFAPVRVEGHDTALTCGLQPRECVVGCVPPAECLSEQNVCIEGIPFVINRMNDDPVKSFTITFTLNEEIELCDGLVSIHEGTFLSDGFATEFIATQLDPITYAVSGSIVGDPCGATGAGGTLLTVDVRRSATGSGGAGVIALSSAELIGCSGQGLEVALGPEATVALCDMAAVGEDPSAQPVHGGASGSLLLSARPNPFGGSVLVHLTLPAAETVSVRIHDATGRVVQTLHQGRLTAGAHVFQWAGDTSGGRAAPAGVYLCSVRTETQEHSVKVFRYR